MEVKGLGSWGEEKAAAYLRRKGYRILEMNYSARGGEIDIIARRGRYLVFVEVKLRKNADFAQGREYVHAAKQQRIINTAKLYLARVETELQPRFDVIEIYAPQGEQSRRIAIEHIENAFET